MYITPLTSAQNEKIKTVIHLSEKSRQRKETGLFVVEGYRELGHCLDAGFQVDSIFFNSQLVSEGQLAEIEEKAAKISEGINIRYYSLSPAIYSKIAYRESTEGIVAVVHAKSFSLDEIVLPPFRDKTQGEKNNNPFILVLESVEKPGNLGALLRTADACGADAVLVCDPLTDLYNPNLIRASLGGIFTQQVVACTSEEACQWLKKNGIVIYTAQLQDSEWYYRCDMVQPCAIVMGSESGGLTPFWRKASDARIKIPMLGKLDSLNVSVSAAVLCYEVVRQRESRK